MYSLKCTGLFFWDSKLWQTDTFWFMFGKLTHHVWQTDTKRVLILVMHFWYILILFFFFKTYNHRGVFSVAFLEGAFFDFLMGIFSICSCFFFITDFWGTDTEMFRETTTVWWHSALIFFVWVNWAWQFNLINLF